MKYFPLFAFLSVALAIDMEIKPLCEVISSEYKVACENTSKLASKHTPAWKECFKKCKSDIKCIEECPKVYDKIYKEPEAVKALECADKCGNDTICISKCPNIVLTPNQVNHAINCSLKCNQELECSTKCAGNLLSPDLNKTPISISSIARSYATSIAASSTGSVTSVGASNTGSISTVAIESSAQNSKPNSSTSIVKANNTFAFILSICIASILHLFTC